ncbi:hypothetical protein ACFVVM_32890 [Nocardia sp. NPDC058176]|uniref:hypothetical protein n=1 Tax=Nocardia sp. NPDC058176 TaxID=3346368 RepID=UPI0036DF8D5D
MFLLAAEMPAEVSEPLELLLGWFLWLVTLGLAVVLMYRGAVLWNAWRRASDFSEISTELVLPVVGTIIATTAAAVAAALLTGA